METRYIVTTQDLQLVEIILLSNRIRIKKRTHSLDSELKLGMVYP